MREPVTSRHPWAVGASIAVLVVIVASLRIFFYQTFSIPSLAMQPTLEVGDYIVLSKRAYASHLPERGDVVVFKMPNPNSSDFGRDYVKRIIGLPGDRVQMINDRLYINDKEVPRRRMADYIDIVDGTPQHVEQFEESLPGGRKDVTLDRMSDGPMDSTGIYVVPPGHYFMMGDNRDNSNDSREDVGYVPLGAIEGRATMKFISAGRPVLRAIN